MARSKLNGKTYVSFVLDQSGSMGTVREATISGFNEYIDSLRKENTDFIFSLTLFDTEVYKPIVNQPLNKVGNLNKDTYKPNGMTALYDAVCSTIKAIGEPKDKVIFIIMTDGEENSSREYNQKIMRELIEEREKMGSWKFVYLGANQDSYAVAQAYGIKHDAISNYHASDLGTKTAMRTMASNTAFYAQSAMNNNQAFFSKEDQEKLGNTK